jgi:hypothetical protein
MVVLHVPLAASGVATGNTALAMPHLIQPLLIVHGENDKGCTVDDATRSKQHRPQCRAATRR